MDWYIADSVAMGLMEILLRETAVRDSAGVLNGVLQVLNLALDIRP
jgi:hypothetical protein